MRIEPKLPTLGNDTHADRHQETLAAGDVGRILTDPAERRGGELVPIHLPATQNVGQSTDEREGGPGRYGVDARAMTPRQMTDLSLDLYLDGAFDYETYALLAFQPDLHPDYNRTIGALTGEAPQPDTPRDFIRQWEERMVYERKYGARDEATLERIRRIVNVLRVIDAPATELVA